MDTLSSSDSSRHSACVCSGGIGQKGPASVATLQNLLEADRRTDAENYLGHLCKDAIVDSNAKCLLSTYTFNVMISYWSRLGKLDRAEFWLQKLIDTGLIPNAYTFGSLINACAESGNPEKLAYYKNTMEAHGMDKNAVVYNTIIKAVAHHGDVNVAQGVLAEMGRTGIPVSIVTYNSLINTCARAGALERAELFLDKMESAGLVPNVITYNSLINVSAKLGRTDRAVYWFDRMLLQGVQPTCVTYGTICKVFAQKGEVEHVEAVMEQFRISGQPLNEYFFASLISACGAKDPPDHERAKSAVEEMVQLGLSPKAVRCPLQRIFGTKYVQHLLSSTVKQEWRQEQPKKISGHRPNKDAFCASIRPAPGLEAPRSPPPTKLATAFGRAAVSRHLGGAAVSGRIGYIASR